MDSTVHGHDPGEESQSTREADQTVKPTLPRIHGLLTRGYEKRVVAWAVQIGERFPTWHHLRSHDDYSYDQLRFRIIKASLREVGPPDTSASAKIVFGPSVNLRVLPEPFESCAQRIPDRSFVRCCILSFVGRS